MEAKKKLRIYLDLLWKEMAETKDLPTGAEDIPFTKAGQEYNGIIMDMIDGMDPEECWDNVIEGRYY